MSRPPIGPRLSRVLVLVVLVVAAAAFVGLFAGSELPAAIGAWAGRVIADVRSLSPFS